MFRKLRDHQSQQSHCVGDSSSQGCFEVGEGLTGCCPREGRHGLACAHTLLLKAGHPLHLWCSVSGVPSRGEPQ